MISTSCRSCCNVRLIIVYRLNIAVMEVTDATDAMMVRGDTQFACWAGGTAPWLTLRTAIASGGIFTYTYHKMSRVESWLPPGCWLTADGVIVNRAGLHYHWIELHCDAESKLLRSISGFGYSVLPKKTNFNVQTCKRRSDNKFVLKVGLINS